MWKILTLTLSVFLSLANLAGSFEIPEDNLFVRQIVGKNVVVCFENGEFFAEVNGISNRINHHDISGIPRDLTEEGLRIFLSQGYLSLKKIGNDFGIEGKIRLLGGTPPEEKNDGGVLGAITEKGPVAGCVAVCMISGLDVGSCYTLCNVGKIVVKKAWELGKGDK
jgi:hypothetical protein